MSFKDDVTVILLLGVFYPTEKVVGVKVGPAPAVDGPLHGGVLPAGGQRKGPRPRLLPPLRQVGRKNKRTGYQCPTITLKEGRISFCNIQ
jgi:hypothetical protein